MAPHSDIDDEQELDNGYSDEERPAVDISGGSDEEEEEEEEFDLKKRFDEILKDLKTGSLDLAVPSQRDSFLARNSHVLGEKTNDEQQNLLHILANSDREVLPSSEKLEPLVKILVRLPENLLAETDGDNKTPLYVAAARAKKKHRLLRAMCEAHSNIDSVLGIQCFNKETCLHVAIRKKASQAHVLYLVGLAGQRTLCVQDSRGNTPLHVAVDYELCSEDQIKIVKALVAKSDAAMDIVNAKGLSPYRYHEDTRTEALNKVRKAQESIQRRGAREADRGGSQG
jgi:hypothetical protein